MYSRYPGRSDRPIRLPEHYSGCAFPPTSAYPARPSDDPPISVPFTPASAQPTQEAEQEKKAAQTSAAHDEPVSPAQEPRVPPHEAKEGASPVSQPEEPKALPVSGGAAEGIRSLFSGKFPAFPGGMSFDELLIIGLILLLSHSEQDSDIILWLALLLFCK